MEELFTKVKTNFRPDHAKGMDAVFEFHADEYVVQMHIHDQICDLEMGSAQKADTIISASKEDWALLIERKMNPQLAFLTGRLRVQGNLGLATKLQALFL